MPGDVLLLSGPAGSGKTTTARLMAAAAPRATVIESDSFFHFVRGGYIEPWLPESHEQNVIVMGAVAAAASAYADGGYATIVDGIISPRWFLRPLRDKLSNSGHAVSYAILKPTLATCIARAADRASGELSNPEVITKLWNDFADVDGLERNIIDVEDLEAGKVAEIVLRRWQTAELLI